MDQIGFEIKFNQHPWECQITRSGEVIFHLTADGQPLEIRTSGSNYQVAFSEKHLTIQVQTARVSFLWQGKAIQNQIQMLGNWYGGGGLINQYLRLNQIMLPLSEFATDDNGPTGLPNLLSPVWLNSQGVALSVNTPFQIGINQPPQRYLDRQKGVSQDLIPFNQRPFSDRKGEGDQIITLAGDDLAFDLHIQKDILACYRSLGEVYGRPEETPPLELSGAPIWTTWARYKDKIDQDTVLEFAREIAAYRFPRHVLEIDDRWQTEYGDLEFDPERFPDPDTMLAELKDLGFKVTLWVMPFFHPESTSGKEAARRKYLVQTPGGEPYRVKWWQGAGYLLDVTNPEALAWQQDRLARFQEAHDLDGYKFDAGEAKFVPPDGVFFESLRSRNEYTHRYINWIAENNRFCEVRSGWKNQSSPIFFRLWDLWSTWGYDNGLRSIIPSTLTLSLAGYPFVFPDMIGGNAYFQFPSNRILTWILQRILVPLLERRMKNNSHHPDEESLGLSDVPSFLEKSVHFGYPTPELLIRWAQASTFLQVMQFSLAPWDFGEKAIQLCREYAQLHIDYFPVFEKLTRQAVETGEPVIRPVFWLAPEDERALVCDDQFLVGDEILVAPVLYPHQRSREIYFPPGKWVDYWSKEIITGPVTLAEYPAPLEKLPFFIRYTADGQPVTRK